MSWADSLYYDKQGNPISVEEFSRLKFGGDMEYGRIGLTQVGPYTISTVWLGIDHAFGEGPPVLFETMVFATDAWEADRSVSVEEGRPPLHEFDCQRYCTEEEAQIGHEEMVLLVRATVPEIPEGVDEERITDE